MLGLWAALALAAEPLVVRQDVWVEPAERATVEQVSGALAAQLQPMAERAILPLGPQRTAWVRLVLQPPANAPTAWTLDIQVPLLDDVTLYQRNPAGRWTAQAAGDRLAVAQWARPGRHPTFDLTLRPGAPVEVYLRVRHSDPIGFALRLGPAASLEQTHLQEYLVLGLLLGTLILLTVSCLIQGALHRDITYAWYAAYAATMTLTMATVTGVTGHLLWNQSPLWNDAAQGVLPVLLAGVNVLFLRHLCSVSPRYPRLARVTLVAGVAILLAGLVYPLVSGQLQSHIVAACLVLSPVLGFVMATLAWRRHDAVGGWVMLAYIPLAFTVAVAVLRLQGWVAAGWLTIDASAAASALAVPLLLLALGARAREWRSVQTRVSKLTDQDALTGLMSPAAFERQLKAAVSGALMRREAAAVVLVDIANLPRIRRFHGDALAEQALLRAVIKLHRVVRESDPAGRIGTGRFGIIFEGLGSRDELQERMVRLVASGLVPSRGAKVEVPLRIHVACVVLADKVMAPELLMRDLSRLLDGMSQHTRRPVRFLEPTTS